MAATYARIPKAPLGFCVPFHLETDVNGSKRGEELAEADPSGSLELRDALGTLKGIYIDCGWSDSTTSTTAQEFCPAPAEHGIRHTYEDSTKSLRRRLQMDCKPSLLYKALNLVRAR